MSNSAEMSGSEGISGHELIRRVLDHPKGGVAALIELAAGGETEWLEFKAAMVGLSEDRKNPKENDADGHWNVAEAVLAMANSRGGAVVVGVKDSGQAVGLAAGDPRKIIESHGAEAYRRREILDRIRPPQGPCRWATGAKGTWELERPWPPDLFSIRADTFQGKDIAVILVRPLSQEESCLIAKQNGDERLLRRVQGHIRQVETLRGRHSISQYEQTRRISGEDLAAIWERFRMRVEAGASEDDDLEAAVAAWHSKLRAKCADLLVAFTPLDAEERLPSDGALEVPVPREVFQPRATETLPDYLRDEFFDESSDDDQENSTVKRMNRQMSLRNPIQTRKIWRKAMNSLNAKHGAGGCLICWPKSREQQSLASRAEAKPPACAASLWTQRSPISPEEKSRSTSLWDFGSKPAICGC